MHGSEMELLCLLLLNAAKMEIQVSNRQRQYQVLEEKDLNLFKTSFSKQFTPLLSKLFQQTTMAVIYLFGPTCTCSCSCFALEEQFQFLSYGAICENRLKEQEKRIQL